MVVITFFSQIFVKPLFSNNIRDSLETEVSLGTLPCIDSFSGKETSPWKSRHGGKSWRIHLEERAFFFFFFFWSLRSCNIQTSILNELYTLSPKSRGGSGY